MKIKNKTTGKVIVSIVDTDKVIDEMRKFEYEKLMQERKKYKLNKKFQ